MSFLAPLFLLGGLAIGLPVIFHLIRRTSRKKQRFSSLMFLAPTPPRLTRRSRLEHWLLLALRCLVILLLAFAFARPFFPQAAISAPPAANSERLLILIDTSASMRRPECWSEALQRAESALRKTAPSDEVAVWGFDRTVRPLLTFEEWDATVPGERVALALQKLKQTSPGWEATRLGDSLVQAAEALAESGKAPTVPARLIVITDLQEGSQLERLQGFEWPKNMRLALETVHPELPGNAALQWVQEDAAVTPENQGSIKVRVANSPDSRQDQFRLQWSNPGVIGSNSIIDVHVPAGQSRIVRVPVPAGTTNAAGHLVLTGDNGAFDNQLFVAPPVASAQPVVYFGDETGTNTGESLFFLIRALEQPGAGGFKVLRAVPGGNAKEIEAAALLVASGEVGETGLEQLKAAVQAGKTLLFVMRDEGSTRVLKQMLGTEKLECAEAEVRNYAMISEVDLRHPLFMPLADPRFSDFRAIHVWKYRKLGVEGLEGARVVARFDSGDPAVLEIGAGKGRIIVFTFGWHARDSQLALSTKFVPLMHGLAQAGTLNSAVQEEYYPGDAIPLRQGESAEAIFGISETLRMTNHVADTPGVYRIVSGDVSRIFVVNISPGEGRTLPTSEAELGRLGVPLGVADARLERSVQRTLRNQELESNQKLWRWLLWGTLAVLLVETWLAGRTTRQAMRTQEVLK